MFKNSSNNSFVVKLARHSVYKKKTDNLYDFNPGRASSNLEDFLLLFNL